jgi:uncharacterized protein (DUF2126 family)
MQPAEQPLSRQLSLLDSLIVSWKHHRLLYCSFFTSQCLE